MKKTIAEMKQEIRELEETTINQVMDILGKYDRRMTAQEISAKVGGVMSAQQIGANLKNVGQFRNTFRGSKPVSRFYAIGDENAEMNITVEKKIVRFAEVAEDGSFKNGGQVLERVKKIRYYQLEK